MATILKLPSGKYRPQVRKGGIYKARTFQLKADATYWATDFERAIEGRSSKDTIAPSKSMTLAEVITAYLKQVTVGRTIRVNLTRVSNRIGSTPIKDVSSVTLRGYIDSRKAEGVKGATLAGDLSNLSSVLKWARHVRNLDINPDLAKSARQALTA